MKESKPSWIKKVTRALPFHSRRDAVIFFVFILIATIFWGVQTAHQEHESTFVIQLEIEHQPPSAVFTTPVPKELKVKLYDNNLQLFDYQYNKAIKTIKIDFERYADVMGNFRISGTELQSLILNDLSTSTKVTSITPAYIDARFAMTEGKKVPVRLNATCTAAPNYRSFEPHLSMDSVLVNAPNSILDTLKYVETEPCVHYGLKDTLTVKLGLKLGLGIKASPDTITCVFPVAQQVEKRIDNVDIEITDLPSDKQLIIFPRKASLKLLVNYHDYNRITAKDFSATVSYKEIVNAYDLHLPIHVKSKLGEDSVFKIEAEPSQVECIIVVEDE